LTFTFFTGGLGIVMALDLVGVLGGLALCFLTGGLGIVTALDLVGVLDGLASCFRFLDSWRCFSLMILVCFSRATTSNQWWAGGLWRSTPGTLSVYNKHKTDVSVIAVNYTYPLLCPQGQHRIAKVKMFSPCARMWPTVTTTFLTCPLLFKHGVLFGSRVGLDCVVYCIRSTTFSTFPKVLSFGYRFLASWGIKYKHHVM
jgi:hypothetical protein